MNNYPSWEPAEVEASSSATSTKEANQVVYKQELYTEQYSSEYTGDQQHTVTEQYSTTFVEQSEFIQELPVDGIIQGGQGNFIEPVPLNNPDLLPTEPEGQYIEPEGQYIEPEAHYTEPQYIQPVENYIEPAGQYIEPAGQYVEPAGQYIEPEGQYVEPEEQYIEPEGQRQHDQSNYQLNYEETSTQFDQSTYAIEGGPVFTQKDVVEPQQVDLSTSTVPPPLQQDLPPNTAPLQQHSNEPSRLDPPPQQPQPSTIPTAYQPPRNTQPSVSFDAVLEQPQPTIKHQPSHKQQPPVQQQPIIQQQQPTIQQRQQPNQYHQTTRKNYGRPPCALISLGFGGSLVRVHTATPHASLSNVSQWLPSNDTLASFKPCLGSSDRPETKLMAVDFLSSTQLEDEDQEFLCRTVAQLVHVDGHRGRFEKELKRMLERELKFDEGEGVTSLASSTSVSPNSPSLPLPTPSPTALSTMERLLVLGKHEDAIIHGIENGLWAQALVVASYLGASAYRKVVSRMVDSTSKDVSSSLVLKLLGGMSSGVSGEDWQKQLCGILSSPAPSTKSVLMSLGDELNVEAAHVCYLGAGCGVLEMHEEARVVLLGGDHMDAQLFVTPLSIQLTEAFLFASGEEETASFQPFRLVYAMWLADSGYTHEARLWVDSIFSMFNLDRQSMSLFDEAFMEQLQAFHDRLRVCCEGVSASEVKYDYMPEEEPSPKFEALDKPRFDESFVEEEEGGEEDGYDVGGYEVGGYDVQEGGFGVQDGGYTLQERDYIPQEQDYIPQVGEYTTKEYPEEEAYIPPQSDTFPAYDYDNYEGYKEPVEDTPTEQATEAQPEEVKPNCDPFGYQPPVEGKASIGSVHSQTLPVSDDIVPAFEPMSNSNPPLNPHPEASSIPPPSNPPPNPGNPPQSDPAPVTSSKPVHPKPVVKASSGSIFRDMKGWLVQTFAKAPENATVAKMGTSGQPVYDKALQKYVWPGEDGEDLVATSDAPPVGPPQGNALAAVPIARQSSASRYVNAFKPPTSND